ALRFLWKRCADREQLTDDATHGRGKRVGFDIEHRPQLRHEGPIRRIGQQHLELERSAGDALSELFRLLLEPTTVPQEEHANVAPLLHSPLEAIGAEFCYSIGISARAPVSRVCTWGIPK